MEKDRSELNDLSDQFPEIKQRLIGKWETWADKIGVVGI
jgi:hypothetical protein